MQQEPGQSPSAEAEAPQPDAGPVFLTDASAEVESLARKARQNGYVVVDVPLAQLRERAAVQRPALVLLDADADGALDVLPKLRDLPGGERIVVFAFGREAGALRDEVHAQGLGIAKFFARPVEEHSLLFRLEEALDVPPPRRSVRPSNPPARAPSQPPLQLPPSSQKAEPYTSRSGLPSSGLVPPAPMSGPSLLPSHRSSLLSTLSPELEQMLAEAEHRVHAQSLDQQVPSPEEELEAVLPADLLHSLDEPIDDDEDDELDAIVGPAKGTGGGSATTGASGTGVDRRTGAGERLTALRRERERERDRDARHTQDIVEQVEPEEHDEAARRREVERERELARERELLREREAVRERERELEREREAAREREAEREREAAREREASRERERLAAANRDQKSYVPERASRDSDLPPTPRDGRRGSLAPSPLKSPLLPPRPARLPTDPPPRSVPRARETSPSPPAPGLVVGRLGETNAVSAFDPGKSIVLSAHDAPRVLAEAIAARCSGALAFSSEGILRRVLLREGDIVTVASGDEAESLVIFLAARGELPRDEAENLRAKLPPFGRHAGAALVAHGHLRQDQLWPVLRAHAEWLLSRCLRISEGTAALEAEPSGRLKSEPNVFGGAPGVATFVEAIRRVFEPESAAERLGGERTVLAEGATPRLVLEAHLDADVASQLEQAKGQNISSILAAHEELLPVAYALVQLGALSVLRGVSPPHKAEPEFSEEDVRALDEDAIRARVRARMAHVEEGDYFAVLGLARDATGYEVRRAFLALRRDFEPSRLLTPRTVDLREDVEHIVVVLEEAYEILRDSARRERYRRAIEMAP